MKDTGVSLSVDSVDYSSESPERLKVLLLKPVAEIRAICKRQLCVSFRLQPKPIRRTAGDWSSKRWNRFFDACSGSLPNWNAHKYAELVDESLSHDNSSSPQTRTTSTRILCQSAPLKVVIERAFGSEFE